MRPRLLPVFLLSLPLTVAAGSEDPLSAIAELGRLNGEALACGQLAVSKQAKQLMIDRAPKTRRYGEVFEEQTSQAFLARGKDALCPAAEDFDRRLSDLTTRVQQLLPLAPASTR